MPQMRKQKKSPQKDYRVSAANKLALQGSTACPAVSPCNADLSSFLAMGGTSKVLPSFSIEQSALPRPNSNQVAQGSTTASVYDHRNTESVSPTQEEIDTLGDDLDNGAAKGCPEYLMGPISRRATALFSRCKSAADLQRLEAAGFNFGTGEREDFRQFRESIARFHAAPIVEEYEKRIAATTSGRAKAALEQERDAKISKIRTMALQLDNWLMHPVKLAKSRADDGLADECAKQPSSEQRAAKHLQQSQAKSKVNNIHGIREPQTPRRRQHHARKPSLSENSLKTIEHRGHLPGIGAMLAAVEKTSLTLDNILASKSSIDDVLEAADAMRAAASTIPLIALPPALAESIRSLDACTEAIGRLGREERERLGRTDAVQATEKKKEDVSKREEAESVCFEWPNDPRGLSGYGFDEDCTEGRHYEILYLLVSIQQRLYENGRQLIQQMRRETGNDLLWSNMLTTERKLFLSVAAISQTIVDAQSGRQRYENATLHGFQRSLGCSVLPTVTQCAREFF